jgi:hypothetical protein
LATPCAPGRKAAPSSIKAKLSGEGLMRVVYKCGGDPELLKSMIDGWLSQLLLENYYRQQVCLKFAEQQDALRALHSAKKPARSSASSASSSSKTSGKSSLSAPATKGSNTGAMDRLSGDSQLPNLSRPSSISGEGNRLVPARGGASTVAKPVNNTPAPSPTIDFGNCASCGRSPSPPR